METKKEMQYCGHYAGKVITPGFPTYDACGAYLVSLSRALVENDRSSNKVSYVLAPGVEIISSPMPKDEDKLKTMTSQLLGTPGTLKTYAIMSQADNGVVRVIKAERIAYNGTTILFLIGSETIAYVTYPAMVFRVKPESISERHQSRWSNGQSQWTGDDNESDDSST